MNGNLIYFLLSVIIALIGAHWVSVRSELANHRSRLHKLEGEMASATTLLSVRKK